MLHEQVECLRTPCFQTCRPPTIVCDKIRIVKGFDKRKEETKTRNEEYELSFLVISINTNLEK